MKLSVIIPCYNEEKCIKENIEKTVNYLNTVLTPSDYEIIAVSDGSKDDTLKIIESIPSIKGIGYTPNRGKGGAVKYGIEHAYGDYVLFMDADLSTSLNSIKDVLDNMYKYDVISGSRHHKKSVIVKKQPLSRVFIGWCCRKLVNMKFHFHLSDTQCGFKAFRASFAKEMVKKQIINGFAFDVEYLYIAFLNKQTLKEIPVVWSNDEGSTVSPIKSSIRFFGDMTIIKKNKKNYLMNK